MLHKITLTY